MIRDRLERIRERAYALWEKAGGGHGQHETHWHEASDEIAREDAETAKPRSRKPQRTAVKSAENKTKTRKIAAGAAPTKVPQVTDQIAKRTPKSRSSTSASANPVSSVAATRPVAETKRIAAVKPTARSARSAPLTAPEITPDVTTVSKTPAKGRGRKPKTAS